MLHLQVYCKSDESTHKVRDLLLFHRFAKTVEVDWNRSRFVSSGAKITEEKINKISCITKAAFFDEIQELIHQNYSKEEVEVFSVPLVSFDWTLSEGLRDDDKFVKSA
ncbi:hypothetical protein [Jiulongibacter sediminis]|jgi:hypothetical protein|uniref:hypothetical protein n=1 Tax=Jiulongibacter sediminis TaxID=1605367 RepID=UPI0026F04C38|nr:hypothetical protein [Jiulongibacter sediminis]